MHKNVSFNGLDAVLWTPEKKTSDTICVFVHPWSVLGGSAANTEPYAETLADNHGIESLTFDLRGVGQSNGTSTYRGTAEIEDVKSACKFIAQTFPNAPIAIVGTSAGAAIGGSAYDAVPEAIAYVGIGYTFGWASSLIFGHHFKAIIQSKKPKLFIMGTRDEFTSVGQLKSRVETMENVQYEIIGNVGHFQLESPQYSPVISQIIAKYIHSLKSVE